MTLTDVFMLALYLGGVMETFDKGRRAEVSAIRAALAALVWPGHLGSEIVRRIQSGY